MATAYLQPDPGAGAADLGGRYFQGAEAPLDEVSALQQQQLMDDTFAARIQEQRRVDNLREFEEFYRIFTDENAK